MATDELDGWQFGFCPTCRNHGACESYQRSSVCVCHRCRTWWDVGIGLFESCYDETKCRELIATLEAYREVKQVRRCDRERVA